MPDSLYLHPSITSKISDESQVPEQAQGLTMLFAPVFAEKGRDNVLTTVDTPSEYVDKFGEANSAKYGQGPLNVVEWTKGGGTAVVMRLLPEDATYAHAILDFQVATVEVQKWTRDTDGKPVERVLDPATGSHVLMIDGSIIDESDLTTGYTSVAVDRKIVRPVIKYVADSRNEDTIAVSSEKLKGAVSEDGFKHFPLGYFKPIGRGSKFYNDLMFKFSVNDSYDNTYDFRVFDVELYQQVDNSSVKLVDGPFSVSFDPSAMDLSQESMFITDVLKKYAKEVTFVMDEEVFDDLGAELNPDVNPGKQDFLFLNDRIVEDVPQNIHDENILSTGMTVLSGDVAAGDTVIYVENPEVINPDGSVIVAGVAEREVVSVDVITGKVVLSSGLPLPAEDGSPVSVVTPDEFRQTGVTGVAGAILTCVETTDSNGNVVVIPGPATLTFDGNVEEVVVESVDTETDEIVLSAAPEGDYIGVDGVTPATLKQVCKEADGSVSMDFDQMIQFKGGSEGILTPLIKDQLLISAFSGTLNEDVLLLKQWPFDVVLDANYNDSVKVAANTFVSVLRQDCVFICDTRFTANPQQAIDYRDKLGFSTFFTSIFSQDASVFDPTAGRRTKVTMPYFIAKKIPLTDRTKGIHIPFVGPENGVLDGFEDLSWNPNDPWQERLYRKKINYTKREPRRTMLFGQLTSQGKNSALSDLSHVRTLLKIQREVNDMMSDFQFKLITQSTLDTMNYNLNGRLRQWKEDGAFEEIKGSVYSSAYDKKQKTVRVRIEMIFTSVLERVIVNLVVK